MSKILIVLLQMHIHRTKSMEIADNWKVTHVFRHGKNQIDFVEWGCILDIAMAQLHIYIAKDWYNACNTCSMYRQCFKKKTVFGKNTKEVVVFNWPSAS